MSDTNTAAAAAVATPAPVTPAPAAAAAPAAIPAPVAAATPAPTPAPAAVAAVASQSLSTELKSAILAAADAHLASVGADVAKVKGAVTNDCTNLVTTVATVGQSEFDRLEASVVAEVTKLRTEVAAMPVKYYLIGGAAAVVAVGAALGHFVVHLF